MSLFVSTDLLLATTAKGLAAERKAAKNAYNAAAWELPARSLGEPELKDIVKTARAMDDTKIARAAESILKARSGLFSEPIPNFNAFQPVLQAYLKAGAETGWIFVRQCDGTLLPELLTEIIFDDGQGGFARKASRPKVKLFTLSYAMEFEGGERYALDMRRNSYVFEPGDVANRRIADALSAKGIYKEDAALVAAYHADMKRHRGIAREAFGRQFRLTGPVLQHETDGWRRRGEHAENLKVIWDLEKEHCRERRAFNEAPLLNDANAEVPEHPHVRIYDLGAHEYLWVNSAFLQPYVYDKSLRDKLILPDSHRDLLDILTDNLSAFSGDIVEGKSTGNTILCKGLPGLGKTLSAEVYAELTERPLLKLHSGLLGTDPESIQQGLSDFFRRARRWDAVLLLDECDVFVMRRGNDVTQQAIVAEFLRALEYYDGLTFMTTNRPDDIDEAILERCIAIIDFEIPDAARQKKIWGVMSDQFNAGLSDKTIDSLVAMLPGIKPRDIKMLLSVALRVAAAANGKPTLDHFRRCAIFRGLKIA